MTATLSLAGQVALVTGAGSGIGQSIATHLAGAGARVAVTDVDLTAAESVATSLPDARAYRLDVTSADQAAAVAAAVESDMGPIDVLVNNAGVSTMNHVWALTEKEWDFNFAVNAKGVFLVTRAVIPAMMERKRGVIVNTASMAGKTGPGLLAHYAASKWACIGFTKCCAFELGPYNIRVNCVCPGFVATKMQREEIEWESELRGLSGEQIFDEYVKQTPLGRIETPDDVARVVLYLASPASEFLTGADIDITGGAHLP
ncbi:MAG: SDR family oxidoreductase [Thermomicrobiales bacterium]|jgi:NAD(P)-dependent dehydrogenase (short-subunit alcohol dehydrogenase family)|nr:SDR family oxidoreductase [Thermomicrobiales bacterium]